MPRENIIMECTVCKSRNYFTTKNRRKHSERAVLPPFHPLGMLAPVLGGEVVPAFAHRAFHDDVFARHRSSKLPTANGQWPLALGRWLLQNLRDHPRAHRAA